MIYKSVQSLRFIAALMVVVTHATFYIGSRIDSDVLLWNAGAQGVNLFFVISGFVMMLSAHPILGRSDAFKYFMLSRVIRILPLYWILNFLKIVQVAIFPSLVFANPTVLNIICSLLFIPSRNADGEIETFYGVGWTLNFEMAFYVVFGLALLWRIKPILVVAPALLIAATLSIIRAEDWPAVTYLFHPIVLNFLWGVLIGAWCLRGGTLRPELACALILAGTVVIFGWPDTSILELEYAAVVAGIVALEPWLKGRLPRWILFGGDASYSIYLIHPVVGALIAVLLARLGVENTYIAFILIIATSLIAGALTYLVIEKPITKMLRARFLSRTVTKLDQMHVLTKKIRQ